MSDLPEDVTLKNCPCKEVISIQIDTAMITVNEAMSITKDEYKESLSKGNHSSCKCMIDSIKALADILKTLEVYREQAKIKIPDCPDPPKPPPKRIVREGAL